MNISPARRTAQTGEGRFARGILMSALGMVLISPDGLLLRLIHDRSNWDIIFYRSLFSALTLTIVLLARHRRNIFRHLHGVGRYALLSGLVLASGNFLFVNAITHTSVANTLVILATMPLISAVLGRILIGERVRKRTVVTILVAFGGILTIFVGSLEVGNWLGNLFAAGVALVQGLNLIVMRRAGDGDRMPALCLAGYISAGGMLLLGAHPFAVGSHDMLILAAAGLFMLPTSMVLFLSGTRYVPAAEVAVLALIETVLGPIWAWIGVGEIPAVTSIVGGIVVIGSLMTNTFLALRRPTSA